MIEMLHSVAVMFFVKRQRDERGATAVEYGLMVALIAAIIVGAVGFLGQDVRDTFNTVVAAIPGGNP